MQGGGRGVIVSETKEARVREEKARYGAPSRIAVLTNMVGRSEVDDDLAGEIGMFLPFPPDVKSSFLWHCS